MDTKALRRLVKVLNVGSSPQAGEADAALSKGIAIMEEHGFTMDDLLEQVRPNELPQTVCAELARRYCLSRPELTTSGKDEYYRSIFLKIAEKYLPAPARQPSHTRSEQEHPRNEGPRHADADWVKNMDEARRKGSGPRTKANEESPGASPFPGAPGRRKPYSPFRFTKRLNWPGLRFGFLSDALRSPVKTIRLLLACSIFGILPGFALSILAAGMLDQYDIHAFDNWPWSRVLAVATFPFATVRGFFLYRGGWYTQ